MVNCAAWGCTNCSNKKSECHFFAFPKNLEYRQVWISRCQRKMRTGRKWNPSVYARLCSDHFHSSAYERDPKRLKLFGWENAKPKLRSDGVPTIFKKRLYNNDLKLPDVQRGAYRKRRTMEILQEIFCDEQASSSTMPATMEIEETVTPHEADMVITDDSDDDDDNIENINPELCSRKTQTVNSIKTRTRRTQVNLTEIKKSRSIQCNLVDLPALNYLTKSRPDTSPETMTQDYAQDLNNHDKQGRMDLSSDEDKNFEHVACDSGSDSMHSDNMYAPSSHAEDDLDTLDSDIDDVADDDELGTGYLNAGAKPEEERQFLVSEQALCLLLNKCSVCGLPCTIKLERYRGIMIILKMVCPLHHAYVWHSQTMHSAMPWGNLLFASRIMFSGCNMSQIMRLFELMRVPALKMSTFFAIQKYYAVPVCMSVWKKNQLELLHDAREKPLILGGDGRCDSPGHSAKYGTYTLMELQSRKIMDIQLVQVNEVKNSHHMELEGLKRGLTFLKEQSCTISELVTDRHVSVKKFLREEHPDIQHYFDVWHVSKGVGKKLEAAAKKSACSAIRPWIKSTTNHMYWVAASSKEDREIKVDKWLSINNHVVNIHTGHSKNFQQCQHGTLEEERQWLTRGSRAHKVFMEIVGSNYLLRDLANLSPVYQTYALEVFHNVVNHFAPKQTHFFFASMMARMYVAALHFNENGNRQQAVTKHGEQRWRVAYPKSKKGQQAVVKSVKVPATFNYAEELSRAVVDRRLQYWTYAQAATDASETLGSIPKPVTASFQLFRKSDLVSQHKSRFPSFE